jgi:hypothetical protein
MLSGIIGSQNGTAFSDRPAPVLTCTLDALKRVLHSASLSAPTISFIDRVPNIALVTYDPTYVAISKVNTIKSVIRDVSLNPARGAGILNRALTTHRPEFIALEFAKSAKTVRPGNSRQLNYAARFGRERRSCVICISRHEKNHKEDRNLRDRPYREHS